jgi:hypothetical protein
MTKPKAMLHAKKHRKNMNIHETHNAPTTNTTTANKTISATMEVTFSASG